MSEKYDFDGRILEIIDKSRASKKAKVVAKECLFDFFKNNYIAIQIMKMKVRMEDHSVKELQNDFNKTELQGLIEKYFPGDFDPVKDELIIYPNLIDWYFKNVGLNLNTEKEIRIAFVLTLIHECTHKLHYDISIHSRINVKLIKLLRKSAKKSVSKLSISRHSKNIMVDIRLSIYKFIRNIQLEGIAKFIEEESREKIPFTQKMFDYLYIKASIHSRLFEKYFLSALHSLGPQDKLSFINILENLIIGEESNQHKYRELRGFHPYDVGLHMTYTIMYLNPNMKINFIMKLSPLEFIKKYESSIEKHGVRPVVSLTSKKGILDYSDMVSQLNEGAKKFSKIKK